MKNITYFKIYDEQGQKKPKKMTLLKINHINFEQKIILLWN